MSAYIHLLKTAFLQQYTYRANAWLQMIGRFIGFFVMINVWQALYRGADTVRGISLENVITFTIISTFLSTLTSSRMAFDIASKVKDGTISLELIKPINFRTFHIFNDLGRNIYNAFFVVLPPAVLVAVLFGFEFPDGFENLLLSLVSAISGIMLVFYIHYIFGILAFWFQTAEYVSFFIRACMTLFAGSYIPLWFYPKGLYTICLFMPFRLITFEPIALYLGRTTGIQALQIIALQWMWIIILRTLGALMWKQAQKHIIVQGG